MERAMGKDQPYSRKQPHDEDQPRGVDTPSQTAGPRSAAVAPGPAAPEAAAPGSGTTVADGRRAGPPGDDAGTLTDEEYLAAGGPDAIDSATLED
jgi:hypothetical protein